VILSKVWNSIKYYSVGIYNYADEDHCFLLSAGIAFNVLYCILPLSLVIFYFFSATLTSDKAISYVVQYVTSSFPIPVYEEDVRAWLSRETLKAAGTSSIAGIVGGISLFWLASILFSTLRTSLNAVFNMIPKRNVLYQKLLDFILMLIVLVLLLSSTFLSPLLDLLSRLGSEVLPLWLWNLLDTAVPRIVSISLSVLLYVILFRMLPHERLSNKVIFISAATTVVLTEAMGTLFSYYMTHISSIGSLYGTYAFLVGISLWVYYASLAFLIGAEVGWLYKERNEIVVEPVIVEAAKAVLKNPGDAAMEKVVLEEYDKAKLNPAKPAGEGKEPPTEKGQNPTSN
jgi:membrane protein